MAQAQWGGVPITWGGEAVFWGEEPAQPTLTAQDLVTGAPVISQPTLEQDGALTAQDLVTGAPVITQPSMGQTHDLIAQDVVTGAPIISVAELGERFGAIGLSVDIPAIPSCEPALRTCVRLGSRVPITFRLARFCARRWESGAVFDAGVRARPTRLTGFEFEALIGGQTGAREPRWPGAIDRQLSDGSITWIARWISNSSLRKAVLSAEWEADISIEITGQQQISSGGEQMVSAYLEPTQRGRFDVVAWVTFSDNPGHREGFAIELEVR